MLATARLPLQSRRELIAEVPEIFRRRWLPMMQQEAEEFRQQLPELLDNITRCARRQPMRAGSFTS